MLYADIHLPTAFFVIVARIVSSSISVASRTLPTLGTGRRRNSLNSNGGYRLCLGQRQNRCRRLGWQRWGTVYRHWTWQDLNHGRPSHHFGRQSFFTMKKILLHVRNEGSVKQAMIKYIKIGLNPIGYVGGMARKGVS